MFRIPRTHSCRGATPLCLLLAIAACGGSRRDAEDAAVVTTYEGVLSAGTSNAAAVTLVSTVPQDSAGAAPTEVGAAAGPATATATIRSQEFGTVQLTGSYNTVTRTFSLQGSGYQLTATVGSDNTVTGSGTRNGTPLVLKALPSTANSPSVSFCGTYEGTYVAVVNGTTITDPGWGTLSFVIDGNETTPGSGRHNVWGSVMERSEWPYIWMTASGTAALITKPSTLGTTPASIAFHLLEASRSSIGGSWENQRWTGTFTVGDGVGESNGTWSASRCVG